MSNTKFKVIRGSDDAIKMIPVTDGQLYFATDSGKLYIIYPYGNNDEYTNEVDIVIFN